MWLLSVNLPGNSGLSVGPSRGGVAHHHNQQQQPLFKPTFLEDPWRDLLRHRGAPQQPHGACVTVAVSGPSFDTLTNAQGNELVPVVPVLPNDEEIELEDEESEGQQ